METLRSILSISHCWLRRTQKRVVEIQTGILEPPCCWSADAAEFDYRVARRYHFDIDMGDNKHERKPVSHLQNGESLIQNIFSMQIPIIAQVR